MALPRSPFAAWYMRLCSCFTQEQGTAARISAAGSGTLFRTLLEQGDTMQEVPVGVPAFGAALAGFLVWYHMKNKKGHRFYEPI